MRHLWLLVGLLGLLMSGPVWASSYQRIDGTIVDPIQSVLGGDLAESACLGQIMISCVIPELAPGVDLTLLPWLGEVAELTNADLRDADLSGANLSEAFLGGADLSGADLSYARLPDAWVQEFAEMIFGFPTGVPKYDIHTNLTYARNHDGSPYFDPVAAGWTFVPEPTTALLVGIGLIGLAMKRRTHA